jgi:predicted PurR-regulated permease PerM
VPIGDERGAAEPIAMSRSLSYRPDTDNVTVKAMMTDASNIERITALRPRSSLAVRLLSALAIGALLYSARAAFIPIALAVLFSLLLTPPVEALHERGLSRSASALLVMFVLAGLVCGSVNLLWSPAQRWWNSAPATLKMVEQRSRPLALLISRVETLSSHARKIAISPFGGTAAHAASTPAAPMIAAPAQTDVAVQILDQTRAALIGTATVTFLSLFLLAGGPPMLARMSTALTNNLQSAHTLRVITAVRTEVSRYYASIALINLGLGICTAASMWLLGIPNPLLWGMVAAILNFLPYVGSAITLLLLTIVAFVTFESIGHVAAVAASFLVLTTIEGQVIQPWLVGRRLELNPIIVFLTLWFGGWFWGIAGVVMAVPTLLSLKVVARHSVHGRSMVEFLSPASLADRGLFRAGLAAAGRTRHTCPGASRFRKADGDRLLAARDLVAGSTAAQSAGLEFAHGALDLASARFAVTACHRHPMPGRAAGARSWESAPPAR